MARNNQTSALVDGILEVGVTVGVLTAAAIMPNLLQVLDKPFTKYLRSLDQRRREREIDRLITYALREHLITQHYQHGIELTGKGKKRLERVNFDNLSIPKPEKWDGIWRLVMFDIPASHDRARRPFTAKIRLLGFQPLQQSVWIYPFACKDEVALVARTYRVDQFVTYIETNHIDHEEKLKTRFESILR